MARQSVQSPSSISLLAKAWKEDICVRLEVLARSILCRFLCIHYVQILSHSNIDSGCLLYGLLRIYDARTVFRASLDPMTAYLGSTLDRHLLSSRRDLHLSLTSKHHASCTFPPYDTAPRQCIPCNISISLPELDDELSSHCWTRFSLLCLQRLANY